MESAPSTFPGAKAEPIDNRRLNYCRLFIVCKLCVSHPALRLRCMSSSPPLNKRALRKPRSFQIDLLNSSCSILVIRLTLMKDTTSYLLIIALLGLLAQFSSAHICMWSPRQRGPLSIATPGDSACYRPFPVCGNMPFEKPSTTLVAGESFTLEFQQNLNHFWPLKPGHFDAFFSLKFAGNLTDKDFTVPFGEKLPDFDAHDMVTQTNLTITGTVPNIVCDHCVLRLRYVSNNPDEVNNQHDAVFYQCADVQIVKKNIF